MKKIFIVLVCLILSSCAVNKTLQPTGGSKADGTVDMSYSYGGFEKPIIDWDITEESAVKRCKAWGYKDAEAFGGTIKTCSSYYNGSCNSYLVTAKYQCLDVVN